MMGIDQAEIGFSPEQLAMLDTPLDANLIRHRKGAGNKNLAYLKGSTEIDAANRIFGYGKWSYRIVSRTLEKSYDLAGNVNGYFYAVDVELLVVGAAFPFPGDGVSPVKDLTPDGHESARKAATTDALKRALRHYGNAFGLPLYDEEALVDAGDGVLIAVKEVPVHTGQSQKRIVDSGKAAPKQLPAAKAGFSDIPTAAQLIAYCDRLFGGSGKWEAAKERVLKQAIPDDDLSEEQRGRIYQAFLAHEAKASAGGGR